MALAGLLAALASCTSKTTPSSSSASQSAAKTTTSEIVQTSAVSTVSQTPSTSAAPVTSVTSAAVTSESPSVPATQTTKTLDVAALTTSIHTVAGSTTATTAGAGKEATDGFFTTAGGGVDTSNYKTLGAADFDSKNHLLYFTTTGAGTIHIEGKSGSNGYDRYLYLAEANAEDTSITVIARQLGEGTGNTSDATKAKWETSDFVIPEAAKYYVFAVESYSIKNLTVVFDSAIAKATETNDTTETIKDKYTLNPMEAFPQKAVLTTGKTYGIYTINSLASNFWFASKIGVGGDAGTAAYAKNNFLNLDAGDSITIAADASGTLTVWATSVSDSGTIELYNSSNTKVDSNSTLPIYGNTDKKAGSFATTTISAAGNYTLKVGQQTHIYLINFAGV